MGDEVTSNRSAGNTAGNTHSPTYLPAAHRCQASCVCDLLPLCVAVISILGLKGAGETMMMVVVVGPKFSPGVGEASLHGCERFEHFSRSVKPVVSHVYGKPGRCI